MGFTEKLWILTGVLFLFTANALANDSGGDQAPPPVFNAMPVLQDGEYGTDQDNQNNAGTGVADGDMDTDICSSSSLAPIEFDISIPAAEQSALRHSTLRINAYDVDAGSGETDKVYVNGSYVGTLSGSNGQWKESSFDIPVGTLVDGKNRVRIDFTTGWCATVDWGIIKLVMAPPHFTSLPDIDNDGSPELAAVLYDDALQTVTASVKNAKTDALIKQINFNSQFVPKRVVAVPDLNANGANEIALLGVRGSDQAQQVEIRDSLSGAQLSTVAFPASLPSIGLSVLRDSGCASKVCLAVLQQNATVLRVQISDALAGTAIRSVRFSDGYNGKGLGIIADLNGNKKREFALLADAKTSGAAYQVEIRDSKSGALIRNISFAAGEPVRGLLSLADLNQNGGTDLGFLLPRLSQVLVVDTQTGASLNTIDTTLLKPLLLNKETDSGNDRNVVLFGEDAASGELRAEVYDSLTGVEIHSMVFSQLGTTVAFRSIPDINGNGSSELIRVREQTGTPKFVAEIRDGATGALINNIGF